MVSFLSDPFIRETEMIYADSLCFFVDNPHLCKPQRETEFCHQKSLITFWQINMSMKMRTLRPVRHLSLSFVRKNLRERNVICFQ